MAFIDAQYIDDVIGSELREELFPSSAELDRFLAIADAKVTLACRAAGYTSITPTTPPTDAVDLAIVQGAAARIVIAGGMGLRRNIIIDPSILAAFPAASEIANGDHPLRSAALDTFQAVGGSDVGNSNDTSSVSSGPVYTKTTLGGF